MKKNLTILAVTLCLCASTLYASDEDTRQLVKYPEKLQKKMLSNMRDHTAALNEILECLAYDELDKAADIAEHRLGLGARQAHDTGSLAKYMPPGMRQAGYNMHSAASRFARIAKEGDAEAALEALPEVTTACVECHAGYRIR
jgi:hypothetical protein